MIRALILHDLDRNEDRLRGTYDFPFEFHHIDHNHPPLRDVLSLACRI